MLRDKHERAIALVAAGLGMSAGAMLAGLAFTGWAPAAASGLLFIAAGLVLRVYTRTQQAEVHS